MRNIISVSVGGASPAFAAQCSKSFPEALPAGLAASDVQLACPGCQGTEEQVPCHFTPPWELLPQLAPSEDAIRELRGTQTQLAIWAPPASPVRPLPWHPHYCPWHTALGELPTLIAPTHRPLPEQGRWVLCQRGRRTARTWAQQKLPRYEHGSKTRSSH